MAFRDCVSLTGLGAVLLALTGCSSAPQPYSRGQEIPLGPYTVTVSYLEMKQYQGINSLIVHLSIAGVRSQAEVEATMARFLGKFVLRDSSGRKSLGLLMLAKHFELTSLDPRDFRPPYGGIGTLEDLGLSGADPTRWVGVFPVPGQARGFTLLIANPDRKEGQASNVSVELGR